MFEDLLDNSVLRGAEPATPENMNKIRAELNEIAPDFVEFVEKFGWVDVGESNFVVYGWIRDLADFFYENMGVRPQVDAWLIGDDYTGDFHAIDKKTGEVVFLSAGDTNMRDIRYSTFEEFIRYQLTFA